MATKRKPRRGSLAFKPKTRANSPYPKITHYKDGEGVLGFAGYKAGMTRVLMVDDEKDSPSKGREVSEAVTVLEIPDLRVIGARAYEEVEGREKTLTDVLANNLPRDLRRKFPAPKNGNEEALEDLDNEDLSDMRLKVCTQPRNTGIGKKTPEVFEIGLGKSIEDKLELAKEYLGKEVSAGDVFTPGEYVDVISLTKGKGMQGPVQRHGVKLLSHKAQKTRRKAGNIGPWHPDTTSWKVPQAGKDGFNRRTEYNKRILKIGEDPEEINPDEGFKKYGNVKSKYMVLKGSVPGPAKRLIMLRSAIRKEGFPENPEVTFIEK